MKKQLIILFTACNSIAFGQSRSINKTIQDDGKSMSIHISGTIDGRDISYDHTFDLSFLDRSERLTLKDNVLDFLDLSFSPIPESPVAPLTSEEGTEPVPAIRERKIIAAIKPEITRKQNVQTQPFSKEVKYNAQGEMYLHYKFVKNGEDFEYERTLNVSNKSEKERLHIITETEQEIGFSTVK
jgi:hypothetical protein